MARMALHLPVRFQERMLYGLFVPEVPLRGLLRNMTHLPVNREEEEEWGKTKWR